VLDAVRGLRQPARLATMDRQQPHLRMLVGIGREERERAAVGRPLRRGDAAALERERVRFAGRGIREPELGDVLVLLEVGLGDQECD